MTFVCSPVYADEVKIPLYEKVQNEYGSTNIKYISNVNEIVQLNTKESLELRLKSFLIDREAIYKEKKINKIESNFFCPFYFCCQSFYFLIIICIFYHYSLFLIILIFN